MCCQYESGTTVGHESKESSLHRTDLTQLLSFRGRSWNSESRFLAGSVSKRARDKWGCETSPIAISVWRSYLLIHAAQWMSGFTGVTSYFSSQVDNTRVERGTGWNQSILKFPCISKLFLENLQTQTGLSKGLSIQVTEKLKDSLGAWLTPWELNFSSSLYFQHDGVNVRLFVEALGTLGSHSPRFKSCRKEDVFLSWKSQQKNHCISITLIGSYFHS